jgi:N-acyl-D-glutamate deacylase
MLPYAIVLANGRVIDPETKLDAVRNSGIKNGRIEAIASAALKGQLVVDATGLIVAPGFIVVRPHLVSWSPTLSCRATYSL